MEHYNFFYIYEILKKIIKWNYILNLNKTALHIAVLNNDIETVKLLLSHKDINVNAIYILNIVYYRINN